MPNEIVFSVLHFYNSAKVQCSVGLRGYSSTCMSHYLLTKRVVFVVSRLRGGCERNGGSIAGRRKGT